MYCLIGLLTVFLFSTTALADCYFPNGDVSGSDTACNPNSLVSTCCFDGQACLSNGLCVSDPHDTEKARLHRGTCTDKTWKSGNCPRECLDIDNNGVPVYSCNATNTDSYCCYDNCECNSRFEVFSFNDGQPSTVTIIGESFTQSSTPTPSSSSTTPTAASASTTPASASATSTSSPSSASASDGDSSSNKTAIGVGLGVGIPVAALVGVGAFLLWRRRKRNDGYTAGTKNAVEMENNETYYPPATKYAHYADGHEKDATERAYSHATPMSATTATTELPAQSYDPIELPASPPPKPDAPAKK